MTDDGDCGETEGMKIGRETEVLRENLPQHHFFFILSGVRLGLVVLWPLLAYCTSPG
jgi:hypothetical protein